MIRFICDRCGKEWEADQFPMMGCATKDEGQHLMVTAIIDGKARSIQLCDVCEKKIYDQIFAYKYLNPEKN